MPAISAKFTADVSDFQAKLAKATTDVTGFQRTTSQVNSELKKFGNEFSGANVMRAAESMAKAVSDLGGVTKLTEAEQRRLNSAVSEAIAKYDALGQQAPGHLRALKDETEKATQAAKGIGGGVKESEGALLSLKGVASTIGGVMAGAFTVSAIASFAGEVIDLAGDINDTSERLKISTAAVQEFKYGLDQTGSSIDALTGAMEKMSKGLTDGSSGTVAAVRSLNLSLDDLRGMAPEDAFTAIADAIKDVPEPMRQTQLAMELFGRSGAEMLPAIRAGIGDLRQEARDLGQVMSEDAVKGLDTLGSTWDIFIGRAKAGTGELISEIQKAANFLAGLGPKTTPGQRSQGDIYGGPGALGQQNRDLARQLEEREREIEKKLNSVGAPSMFRAAGGFTPDTPSEKDQERANAAQREAVEAALAHARAVKALADTWAAADFAKQLQLQAEAFGSLTGAQRNNTDIANKIVTEYGKLRTHVGPGALPRDLEAFYQAHLPVIKGTRELKDVTDRYVTTSLPDLSKRAQEARNMLAGLTAEGVIPTTRSFGDLYNKMETPVPQTLKDIGSVITDNKRVTNEWKQDFDRTISGIGQDFSGHLASMLTKQEGWKDGALGIFRSFKDGVTDILANTLNYFINSFVKGITNALTGAQGGWGQAFAGAFGGGGGGGGVTGSATNNLTNRAVNWGLGALGVGGATATAVPGITATTGAFSAGVPSLGIGAAAAGGTGAAGTGAGAGAATGGTFGGLTTAGVLGGAAAGGAGLGLGLLGTKIFGGSGWKAAGFGAGTGAATGALIGSVVPGIGTGIGALVGGAAGLIGGWIGKSRGEKLNDARDEFLLQKDDQGRAVFGGSGTGEGSAFLNLSTDLAKVQGGDKLFTNLLKAKDFDDLNAAVKRIVDTLGGAEYNTVKVREGFDSLTKQREALLALGADETKVLESQAGSYSLLFDTIKKTGADVPDAMLPILQQMIDLGFLVDANGEKVTSLADVAFGELERSVGAVGTVGGAALDDLNKKLDEFVAKGYISAEQADDMRRKFTGIQDGADAVEDTKDEVEDLTSKVAISKSKAEELKNELLNQQNAHTTIEGTEGHINDLHRAIQETEQETERLEQALRRLHDASAGLGGPMVASAGGAAPPAPQGAAHGIYAWGPTSAIFGEGGEPELGGSVGFMSKALKGALQQRGDLSGVDLTPLARSKYSTNSQPTTIQVFLDGREITRSVVRHTPGVLRLAGVTR